MRKIKIERIGVLLLGPLGDVVNSSGVFAQLRKNYPNSVLSLITISSGAIAADGIPEIDEIYVFNKYKGVEFFKQLFRFSKSVMNKFDTLIILDNSFRSAFVGFFTLAPSRIGRSNDGRDFLLTHKIPFLEEEKIMDIPVAEHYSRCLKPLGIYEENIGIHFQYKKTDEEVVDELLRVNNLTGKRLLGYCPICHCLKKSFENDDAIAFLKMVKERTDYEVVVVGGNDVVENYKELKNECGSLYVDLIGKTSFLQTACLIDKCAKFVSVDTSVAHLSIAQKTPIVSVFFTNIFKKWGPSNLDFNRLLLNLDDKKVDIEKLFEYFTQINDKSF